MIQTTNYNRLLKRYEFYAPRYDRMFRQYSAATLAKGLEVIPLHDEARLIDVACGTGLLAEMLLAQRPMLEVTGIDISPAMLERARQRTLPAAARVNWVIGRAEELPVPSSLFNVLTCTNAFHLVQDADGALVEFKRVLAPGGTLVLVDWCLDFPVMRLRGAALRIGDRQRRNIRTQRDMTDLIERAGFRVTQSERFLPRPLWGLMCVVATNDASR